MSDATQRNRVLLEMKEEIISRHLKFLGTEESSQKIEERNRLEDCLKQFLCVVPQDRKFTLPETRNVLRKSIREMDNFSAYKAITAFEAISQYANNLVQKPWSREFRVLKTYSGFFMANVSENLLDAEKLFEAMGYRRTTDEIFVLDGSICPQQVRSVSLDAMAAYLECQIIKNIYDGLTSLGLPCSWKDVFEYRENNFGGYLECTRGLALAIQKRRAKLVSTFSYASVAGCAKSISGGKSNFNTFNVSGKSTQKEQPLKKPSSPPIKTATAAYAAGSQVELRKRHKKVAADAPQSDSAVVVATAVSLTLADFVTVNRNVRKSKSPPKSATPTASNNKSDKRNASPKEQAGKQNSKRQTRQSGAKQRSPLSTQLNEWSCRSCTFLNPPALRICEMCCRSKDSNLGGSNTLACV